MALMLPWWRCKRVRVSMSRHQARLPAKAPLAREPRRAALIDLLSRQALPDKAEILRVKRLIRELAGESPGLPRADEFISAYFDLYLGRVVGDDAVEDSALRRCLECLAAEPEPQSREPAVQP